MSFSDLPPWFRRDQLSAVNGLNFLLGKVANTPDLARKEFQAIQAAPISDEKHPFDSLLGGGARLYGKLGKKKEFQVARVSVLRKGSSTLYLIFRPVEPLSSLINYINLPGAAIFDDDFLNEDDPISEWKGYNDELCHRTDYSWKCARREENFGDVYQFLEKSFSPGSNTLLICSDNFLYYQDRLIQRGFKLDNYFQSILGYKNPSNQEEEVQYPTVKFPVPERKNTILTYPGYLQGEPIDFDVVAGPVSFYVVEGRGKKIYLFGDYHIREMASPCSGQKTVELPDLFRIIADTAQKEGRVLDIYLEQFLSASTSTDYYHPATVTLAPIYQNRNLFDKCIREQCYWQHRIHAVDTRYLYTTRNSVVALFIARLHDFEWHQIPEGELVATYAAALPFLTTPSRDFYQGVMVGKKLSDQLELVSSQLDQKIITGELQKACDQIGYSNWVDLITDFLGPKKKQVYAKMFTFSSRIVDLMLFARMVRTFAKIPGRYSEEPTSILTYAGDKHIAEVLTLLKQAGFRITVSVNRQEEAKQCVRIPRAELPLFRGHPFKPRQDLVVRPLFPRESSARIYNRILPPDFPYTEKYIRAIFQEKNRDNLINTVGAALRIAPSDVTPYSIPPPFDYNYTPAQIRKFTFLKGFPFEKKAPYLPMTWYVGLAKAFGSQWFYIDVMENPDRPEAIRQQARRRFQEAINLLANIYQSSEKFPGPELAQILWSSSELNIVEGIEELGRDPEMLEYLDYLGGLKPSSSKVKILRACLNNNWRDALRNSAATLASLEEVPGTYYRIQGQKYQQKLSQMIKLLRWFPDPRIVLEEAVFSTQDYTVETVIDLAEHVKEFFTTASERYQNYPDAILTNTLYIMGLENLVRQGEESGLTPLQYHQFLRSAETLDLGLVKKYNLKIPEQKDTKIILWRYLLEQARLQYTQREVKIPPEDSKLEPKASADVTRDQVLSEKTIGRMKKLAATVGIPGYSKYKLSELETLRGLILEKIGSPQAPPPKVSPLSPKVSPLYPKVSPLSPVQGHVLSEKTIGGMKKLAATVGVPGYSKYKLSELETLRRLILAKIGSPQVPPQPVPPQPVPPQPVPPQPVPPAQDVERQQVQAEKTIGGLKKLAAKVGVSGYSKYKLNDLEVLRGLVLAKLSK